MKIWKLFLGVSAAFAATAGAASANPVFSNPFDFISPNGDCSFSTTCAAAVGAGDDFAAQSFTLTSATLIQAASFAEFDLGTAGAYPTDITWGFIAADGAGGLPGTILAAGTDNVAAIRSIGSSFGYNISQVSFGVGTVALDPGTYYFALQADSPVFETYLGQGVNQFGAAESQDGGATWTATYEGIGGVAVQLFDSSVPEPASWAIMLLGLGGIGGALRRRGKVSASSL